MRTLPKKNKKTKLNKTVPKLNTVAGLVLEPQFFLFSYLLYLNIEWDTWL